ncbi:MAG: hypothetical protein HFE30_04775 [Clostridiales bacterium]|nr:hypothetical protein [Clostridiales bacterium]
MSTEKRPVILLKRPLFAVCGTFFLSSVLFSNTQAYVKSGLASAAITVCIFLYVLKCIGKIRKETVSALAAFLVSAAAALLFSLLLINLPLYRTEKFYNTTVECDAVIENVRGTSSYYGYYTADIRPNGENRSIRVLLSFPDGSCEVGDILHGYVSISALDGSDFGGNRLSLLSDGIFSVGESEDMKYIGRDNSFSVRRFFSKINSKLSSVLITNLHEGGALSCAVLLGNKSYLDNSVRRDFSRLGISHLTAVSGLHLSVICSFAEMLLKRFRIKNSAQKPLMTALILLYMGITGFSVSVMRSGIMNIMRLTADLFGRSSDSETSLTFSACAVLIFNPCSVYDAGLLLSVLSAYACIVYSSFAAKHFSNRIPKILCTVRDGFLMTLLITACTLPVMWERFGSVSVVSPISNLIFIPIMTVFLYISAIYLILCMAGLGSLLTPVSYLLNAVSEAICSAARLGSLFHGINVSLNIRGVGIFIILLSASVIIMPQLTGKAKRTAYVTAMLGALGIAALLATRSIIYSGTGEIVYNNSGKNDGFVFRIGTKYVIADVSDGSYSFLRKLNSAAEENGAAEIDTLIFTHYHMKHISALNSFSGRVMLRHVMLPYPENDKDMSVFDELCRILEKQNIECSFYLRRSGECAELCGMSFGFFDHTEVKRSTHPIISFTAQLGECKITYLGGSFNEGVIDEEELMSSDTAFFGAHSPKYKTPVSCAVGGTSVISKNASAEADFTGCIFGGDTVKLEENGNYTIRRIRLSE